MSAAIYGVTTNGVVPQPDFTASQNEHGGWTAKQTFIAQFGSMDSLAVRNIFTNGKRATELDPKREAIFSFLRLVSVKEVGQVQGGWTAYQAEFTGFYTATYDNETGEETQYPTYSLRGTLEDAPFCEHPKWIALTDDQRNRLGQLLSDRVSFQTSTGMYGIFDEDGKFYRYWTTEAGVWDVATGDEFEFAKRITEGKTTYRRGSFEWTKRWEGSAGLTAAQLNSLSRVIAPPGNPPTPNGGRDWMLAGANQEQTGPDDGYRFRNEVVFSLSERGGHDAFLQDT